MSSNFLTGLSNAEYHADKSHLSSSSLKLLLKDPAQFKHEVIDGLKAEQATKAHFTEGSFTHSLILEPEKIAQEYAIFPGLRMGGGMFEAFKEAHKGKTIVSAAQVHRCERLYASYQDCKVAMEVLAGALPEHSAVSKWLDVPVKCRYDGIVPRSHIVDIKTTASPSDPDMFRNTVKQFGYDLSAALYCQIAYDTFGVLHDYFWVVLSKADYGCTVYKASGATLSEGNAMCVHALVTYKKCQETGLWTGGQTKQEFSEEIIEV